MIDQKTKQELDEFYKDYQVYDLRHEFSKSCISSDMQALEYLAQHTNIHSCDPKRWREIKKLGLIDACRHNQIKVVDFLLSLPEDKKKLIDEEYLTSYYYWSSFLSVVKSTIELIDSGVKRLQKQSTNQNHKQIAFERAAAGGYVQILDLLISHDKTKKDIANRSCLSKAVSGACYHGSLSTVKYLLEQSKIKDVIDLEYDKFECVNKACESGNMQLVKYLLEDRGLKNAITNELNYAALGAASGGHLEILKYILELAKRKQIHCNLNESLNEACYRGHLDVVQYLMESPSSKEMIDLDENASRFFCSACLRKKTEIIKYLIFTYGLKQSKEVEEFLLSNKGNFHFENVQDMFNMAKEKAILEKQNVIITNDKKSMHPFKI